MFNIDFTFLWTLLNLVILFLFLKKFLFGRLSAFMEKRAENIAAEYAAAENTREEVKRMRAQLEEQRAKVAEEAQAILRAAKEKADFTAEAVLSEAKANAEQLLAGARAQSEVEREAAMIAFRADAAALVVEAAGKLLRRNLNSEDNRNFAASLLAPGERTASNV
jgi:F-type H+-transporting ATPase subunit b